MLVVGVIVVVRVSSCSGILPSLSSSDKGGLTLPTTSGSLAGHVRICGESPYDRFRLYIDQLGIYLYSLWAFHNELMTQRRNFNYFLHSKYLFIQSILHKLIVENKEILFLLNFVNLKSRPVQ